MDHYSIEVLGKLHQKELVREALHEQAMRRLRPQRHPPRRVKRVLFVLATAIMSAYFWLFV
jgi:hypothetical protein